MKGGVSVVICCYNSSKRLPETLRYLAAQQVPEGIPWEVVIIDNASSDGTGDVAKGCWPESAPAPLRVGYEPEAGLKNARRCGIMEARGEIISFIDDDNWVAPDWVQRVYSILMDHPEVGACGGRVDAECEIEPPAWFESIKGYYAVGRQYSHSGDITHTSGTLLWGAGLTLRACAVRHLLDGGFSFMMTGRKGNLMLTGEDTELCFALRAGGWHFWYDDDLAMRHFIPKERLQWNYALRLMHGMGLASVLVGLYLMALNEPPFKDQPAWKKTWLFQSLKCLRQLAWLVLSHPVACFMQPEGSLVVLELKKVQGHLTALQKVFGEYKKLGEQIRSSSWAKTRQS